MCITINKQDGNDWISGKLLPSLSKPPNAVDDY